MSKVKRKDLVEKANEHELRLFQIEKALEQHGINWFAEEPKLKQLDQSVFDGLDEKWRFAAVVADDRALYFDKRPYDSDDTTGHFVFTGDYEASFCGTGYDASNWQNSLIERDIAKELLKVDLSSELTGSDLARAMLERGDNYIMCRVGLIKEVVIINKFEDGWFYSQGVRHADPAPINNQGEPLTQSDVGL